MCQYHDVIIFFNIPLSIRRQIRAIDRMAEAGVHFWDYGNAFLLEASRAGELSQNIGVPVGLFQMYRQTFSINRTKLKKLKCFSSRLAFVHWSQVLSRQWRCSWSSADRRCSNYIWVINNFIACQGATCITGLTVVKTTSSVHIIDSPLQQGVSWGQWSLPQSDVYLKKIDGMVVYIFDGWHQYS